MVMAVVDALAPFKCSGLACCAESDWVVVDQSSDVTCGLLIFMHAQFQRCDT